MELAKLRLIFFFSFATLVPTLLANIAEFDEVWKERADKAKKNALDAYQPDPESVTFDFNFEVNKQTDSSSNSTTRRNLMHVRKYKGPCRATNPIDRCWRCRKNWANDRKRLARCVLGFGRKTTGGLRGRYYIVTDCSDDNVMNPKPGTLRHAVIQKQPLWIIFERSMVIKLSKELIIESDKTIDGRGANVQIAYGAGLTIQFVCNVIIHNLKIHHVVSREGGMIRDSVDHMGLRTFSEGDGITIFGSSNVWIDHVSMSKCQDGLIDAVAGSTGITISNSHFTHHNDVMLLGASDSYEEDKIMQVTVAFNHFGQGLIQRMPRCRWGFFHVVNNDYTHWRMYAIGGSKHPTIISQGNRFIAPDEPHLKLVTHRDYAPQSEWMQWTWRSEGDLLMNGALFVQSGAPLKNKPFSRLDMIKAKPGTFVTRLTRFSGTLKCKVGRKC
ncbi:pectate lyase-like [Tripterygium wilfordii]|uniref:Pectate lyase n=1 Tax=Tripterygium wilfordii TaxID=458696 RepID=A0A7J7DRL2_TRIWF|nr:pectate lyase-like [Tripterygium wilfordii]KAF5749018.1 pectate lyase-like [Tripterygium wilfordii]